MKRSILLACAGLLLGACASGADVAEDATSTDTAVVHTLDGTAPPPDSTPSP